VYPELSKQWAKRVRIHPNDNSIMQKHIMLCAIHEKGSGNSGLSGSGVDYSDLGINYTPYPGTIKKLEEEAKTVSILNKLVV